MNLEYKIIRYLGTTPSASSLTSHMQCRMFNFCFDGTKSPRLTNGATIAVQVQKNRGGAASSSRQPPPPPVSWYQPNAFVTWPAQPPAARPSMSTHAVLAPRP